MSFVQSYVGPANAPGLYIEEPQIARSSGGLGACSFTEAIITGTVWVTNADIAAGSKTVTLKLWDDDPIYDDVLTTWTHNISLAGIGGPALVWFSTTTLIYNMNTYAGPIYQEVTGAHSSGESTAELYVTVVGSPDRSPSVWVYAL